MRLPSFHREGSLTLFSGEVRQGKTFAVAMYTLMALDSGIKGFGNLGYYLPRGANDLFVDHPNYKEISFYDLIALKNSSRFVPYCVLSLQEIRLWANSHRAMSDTTEFFDDLVFQSGKKGINIIGDTQLSMRADNALRELATCRFEVEKQCLCDKRCVDSCPYLGVCRFVYWELDRKITDDDVRTEECFSINFRWASHFWNRYKTDVAGKALNESTLQTKLEKLEPKLKLATINRQTKLLIDNWQKFGLFTSSDCKKVRVENALLELGENDVFASNVADKLALQLRSRTR